LSKEGRRKRGSMIALIPEVRGKYEGRGKLKKYFLALILELLAIPTPRMRGRENWKRAVHVGASSCLFLFRQFFPCKPNTSLHGIFHQLG